MLPDSDVEACRPAPQFVFNLFVAGEDVNRTDIRNLRNLCEQCLGRNYQLNVIDVLKRPELADEAGILATPTLVKTCPGPARQILGDLGDRRHFLSTLEITEEI